MAHSWILYATALLHFCLSTKAQPLSSCPTSPTLDTDSQGIQYQVCSGTDIQTPSINIVNSITSITACLQLCRGTADCQKAVYDHTASICHVKGSPTNAPWVPNNQYDAIQYVQTIHDGDQISSNCPTQQTAIQNTDGSQTIICPMSDYQVGSINIIGSVSDVESCAAECKATVGCNKAVYDHINSICHIKGSPGKIPWVVDLKQYDAISIMSSSTTSTGQSKTPTSVSSKTTSASLTSITTTTKAISKTTTTKVTSKTSTSKTSTTVAASTGLPSCPANQTTFTTDDGSLYEICPKTDYQGSSTNIVQNVLSDWDCLQICNTTPNCTRVVFDPTNFTCYVKDKTAVWATANNLDTIRLVNRTAYQPPAYNGLGSWSAPIVMPVIAVAAYIVPQYPVSNRVLMFSSWGNDDFSGPTGITQFADYSWQTGVVSQRTITNTQHDMFCPGISSLKDGRIVITGGENAEVTSFYDPATDSFVRGPDMNLPRGYHSSTTTSSGGVFTVGGSFTGGIGGKIGEVFDPVANAWTLLPGADVTPILTTDAEGAWRTDNHAWLYGWKDGSVFQAGPSKQQHWYDTKGNGSVVAAGIRDAANDAMCGVNVMYDAVAGKIFSTGGSQSYTDSDAFTRTHITTIGAPFQGSQVERVADMANPRGFANGVVLPDGTVLVTGGQQRSLVFTDINSVLTADLFNPVTKTWKTLAPATIPRNYHSVSLLLADGTVFSAGGGMCPTAYGQSDAWCNRAADHPDAQIFSPPYLFNADGSPAPRPIIFALSSSSSDTGATVNAGGTLTVAMNDASGSTFSLIRTGSATHSTNSDQRRVPLTNVVRNQAMYTIQLPSDSGILIPGYYYLFALSKTGVPSIARTVQVI